MSYITDLEKKVLDGYRITNDEGLNLYNHHDKEELFSAGRIAEKLTGNKVDLCSIMNAKSGKCSENCKYCAQSSHYSTGISEYPLVTKDAALQMAKENERLGVKKFSLVTSGNELSDDEFKTIVEIIKTLREETSLTLCASLGAISLEKAISLKNAGLKCYHHNVETSSRYYSEICSTHKHSDRLSTIAEIRKSGLDICSGGIIGMGEKIEDRILMAIELRESGIKNIPVNFLSPVKGTPLENMKTIDPVDALKTIAVFRFIIPDSVIRFAGGRINIGDSVWKGFKSGANAMMVGNFLTTAGATIADDLAKLKSMGLVF